MRANVDEQPIGQHRDSQEKEAVLTDNDLLAEVAKYCDHCRHMRVRRGIDGSSSEKVCTQQQHGMSEYHLCGIAIQVCQGDFGQSRDLTDQQ